MPGGGIAKDQKVAISHTVAAIDQYIDFSRQCTYVKGRVITGSPGSGKSSFSSFLKPIENTFIFKYFIHIEGCGESITYRAEAENFLHDLTLSLETIGFK